jgi:hypothetical protein
VREEKDSFTVVEWRARRNKRRNKKGKQICFSIAASLSNLQFHRRRDE